MANEEPKAPNPTRALSLVLKVSTGVLAINAITLLLAGAASKLAMHALFFTFVVISTVLVRSGRARAAGAVLASGFWVGSTVSVFVFGGVRSPGLFVYLPVVLTAGLFWSNRAAVGLAMASVIAVALAAQLQAAGILHEPAVPMLPSRLLMVFAGAVVMTAVLLAVALRNVAVIRDELDRSGALFEELIREAPDAILSVDEAGIVVGANPAAIALTGYPASELLGVSFTELQLLGPEALGVAVREFGATLVGERRPPGEIELIRRDGTCVVVEGHARRVLRDGGDVRVQVTLRDVTERRRAERERATLERRLENAERLDSIGRLAGGIAHDFNNLLTLIMSSASLLEKQLEPGSAGVRFAREITDASERASMLVRQLLASGRRQSPPVSSVDLNDVLDGMRGIVTRVFGDRVETTFQTEATLSMVRADRTQLEQVVLNLVVNARDAMPEGGRLTIRTANVDLVADASLAPDGRYVKLTVEDEGIGMDPATAARIFEPFFTTKGARDGTGLGLATVYGIVRQASGHIRVDSEPGKGSRFDVFLPCVPDVNERQRFDRPYSVATAQPTDRE